MGRFGNNLFQYSAACLLAKKFGDKIVNPMQTNIVQFDNNFSCKNNTHTIYVNDDNFQDIYESEEISFDMNIRGFFQTRYVVDLFEKNRDLFVEIPSLVSQNFVHVRLGDLLDNKAIRDNMPEYDYYDKCLKDCDINRGFVSSDSMEHPIVKKLIKDHDLNSYNSSEENTILFAASCFNKILSLGTFSWWIGFLGVDNFNHAVFCPKFNDYTKWHGDIFPMKGWIER